jgi:hypothetical protein
MKRTNTLLYTLIVALVISSLGHIAFADVSPGDVVDSSNWQKAEGLLPESVLEWVKKGDFTLNIGTLNYDPKEFYPVSTRDMMKSNVGRYAVNEKGVVVDAKTKEMTYVEGMPFPVIEPNDPQAGIKIVYNSQWSRYITGHLNFTLKFLWTARSGFEREVRGRYLSGMYTGWAEGRSIPNPEGFMYRNIITVTYPYDMDGVTVMVWRYLDDRRDVNFSYIPAIRRVRRMSPASRSDAFLGSDFSLDDSAGYDGKIADIEWNLLETKEAILPYLSENPQEVVEIPGVSGWSTTENMKECIYGFRQEGWKGAPWAPTNLVWVKRKGYVVEGKSKDPYYNYGSFYMWFDADRYVASYKVNHDRAGKYWKTAESTLVNTTSKDGSYRSSEWANLLMVDARTDHASISVQCNPTDTWTWYMKDMGLDDFTLGGFQKYCK